MNQKSTVAVLGLGIMGQAMARRLAEAGLGVRAYNRTRAKADALVDDGVVACGSPREAAVGADFILTMVADGPAVELLASGPDGLLAGASSDAVWLQMSTVGVEACEGLSRLAGSRPIGFVDAPVLGTKGPAERGELLVLASGPEPLRDRCQTVFDRIAKRVLWLGSAGAGSRLKLVINDWLLNLVAALAESVELCRALGLEPQTFFDAIEGGPVGAPYAAIKGPAMVTGSFEPQFPLRLALKDAELVLAAASSRGVALPVTRAVRDQFARAKQAGLGELDMAAIVEALH